MSDIGHVISLSAAPGVVIAAHLIDPSTSVQIVMYTLACAWYVIQIYEWVANRRRRRHDHEAADDRRDNPGDYGA